jgi:hypothetical protein
MYHSQCDRKIVRVVCVFVCMNCVSSSCIMVILYSTYMVEVLAGASYAYSTVRTGYCTYHIIPGTV